MKRSSEYVANVRSNIDQFDEEEFKKNTALAQAYRITHFRNRTAHTQL